MSGIVPFKLDGLEPQVQPGGMTTLPQQTVSHRSLLKIAVPVMLSNVTEPMIGVVNTAVVGQLPAAHLIGGVAVASLIFSFLFWGFGFLRLSTSGLSAQATGAGDTAEVTAIIWRSLLIAVVIGLGLIALSPVLKPLSLSLMGGSADVQAAAATYFSYRIFAAPAALANFAILGWFIGQGRTKIVLITQLMLNLTNMALSVLLVLHFDLGIAGVGLAVLLAEYGAVLVGLLFALSRVLDPAKIKSLITANADMMVRTVCVLFAFGWFTSRGARNGDTTVAANSILLHMFQMAAYLIDGFANAAEALVGQAIGARDKPRYSKAISLSTSWVMGFGALASGTIILGGTQFIDLMTVNSGVRDFAKHYLIWAAITPFLGAACFLYDGVFIGAMATRDMRNMMLLALAAYMLTWFLLEPRFGNHGLWAALSVFFMARGVLFAARLPAIKAKAFAQLA